MNRVLRHSVVLLIVVVMLAGCTEQATFGSAITAGEPTLVPTPIVPNNPIYIVERGDIVYEKRFFGRITPIRSREIQFAIAGRVSEVFVAAGDTVSTGDILATLDTSDLEEQLLDAQEELDIAQSILDSATNQLDFAKQRAELALSRIEAQLNHAITTADNPPTADQQLAIDLFTIDRDLALLEMVALDDGVDPTLRFDVTRAQEQVDNIEALINQTELIATMDGRLISFVIDAGDNATSFQTVAVIADVSEIEVTNNFDISGMSELVEGMSVVMQRAGLPGDVYAGTIVALPGPYGTGVDDLIHVSFDTQPEDDDLGIGDRMSFDVIIDQRDNVLILPSSAIRQFSGRFFVVVQNDSVQQRVDVRLGLEGDGYVEIIEGVEENQTVVGQ